MLFSCEMKVSYVREYIPNKSTLQNQLVLSVHEGTLKDKTNTNLSIQQTPIAVCEYMLALCYMVLNFEPCSNTSSCLHEALTSSN